MKYSVLRYKERQAFIDEYFWHEGQTPCSMYGLVSMA